MEIKIVTYNIHRAIGIDRRFKPERIAVILNKLDADVVLLQEVDEGAPRSRELNLAKEIAQACDYPYFALGHNVSLRKGYYGNATLSRFPILRERNIDLTIGLKKRRGCQHTTLNISSKSNTLNELDIFNLHLGLSAKERQKQAALLFKSQEFKRCENGMPIIIAGDFNDWRSLLRALFVVGKDFYCATDKVRITGDIALKTYPSFAPRGGLDRIDYRGQLELMSVKRHSRKPAKIASDHLPVIATFKL
jgi:endonuclease/exonuclease/phosphatase family metal-dependent hydrolase